MFLPQVILAPGGTKIKRKLDYLLGFGIFLGKYFIALVTKLDEIVAGRDYTVNIFAIINWNDRFSNSILNCWMVGVSCCLSLDRVINFNWFIYTNKTPKTKTGFRSTHSNTYDFANPFVVRTDSQ